VIIHTYQKLMHNGRLGNQLWQICATIANARRSGGEARITPIWEYRDYFSFPEEIFESIPRGARIIDGGTNYYQEYHLISDIINEIREWTRPSQLSVDHLLKHHKEFFSSTHKTAIHVRRGDYLKYPNHFPVVSDRYLQRGIDYVKNKGIQTKFYVFSDDPLWCRSFFSEYFNIVEGSPRPVEVSQRRGKPEDQWDFFCMTMCDEHIISNSTFSYWAALISANKTPIYPSLWFGKELAHLNWESAIPKDWIKIRC
jgi:hypothetical protein